MGVAIAPQARSEAPCLVPLQPPLFAASRSSCPMSEVGSADPTQSCATLGKRSVMFPTWHAAPLQHSLD
eukprot:4399243-Alexandrium_andersonii.AAC.1